MVAAFAENGAMERTALTTRQKALAINLDAARYGTLAEIGAGQEVARWLFQVGGAAGTIAKSISAYDMSVSDALYGQGQRYVSRQRLEAMLAREFSDLLASLDTARGASTTFFVFADTVAASSYRHPGPGRGWMGVRFQAHPREEPSEIIAHVHLFDAAAVHQQEALGAFGINLLYAAFYAHHDPEGMLKSLLDGLSRSRVEVDMIKFSGPAFAAVDNRLMSVELVEQGLTDAAMFTAAGDVVQPSEVFYKRPVLVERGSFRPIDRLSLDVLERARAQFLEEAKVKDHQPVVLAEMTLRSLLVDGEAEVDHADFLARADVLGALGIDVLISRFQPYYQLADYLATYTDQTIGIAIGLRGLREIADQRYYANLAGGIVESTGRLFKHSVKMYVYPGREDPSGPLLTIETAPVLPPFHHLRDLLVETGHIETLRTHEPAYLAIDPDDVLARIERGDPGWEPLVPAAAVEIIKARRLFGYRPAAPARS